MIQCESLFFKTRDSLLVLFMPSLKGGGMEINMIETIKVIINDVLKAVYQPFFFALLLSVFILFFVMYLEKYKNYSLKEQLLKAFSDWIRRFKESGKFRRLFYLIFFMVMILFKTLLNREMWTNPIADVIGVWGIYKKDGTITSEIFENVLLFIPFIICLFLFLETTKIEVRKFLPGIWKAIWISFVFSLTIEMLQLFLRLGTWQLSDIFFNTLGGLIGGNIYYICLALRRSGKDE